MKESQLESGFLLPICRDALLAIIDVLEQFREFDNEMSSHTMLTFLYAILLQNDEACGHTTVKQLADTIGISPSAASRNVFSHTALSESGTQLLHLVENPKMRNQKMITLTEKGEAMMHVLLDKLREHPDNCK